MTAFICVNTQTTSLTINCNSTATYKGDPNQTTDVAFYYQNNLLWTTRLNNTNTMQKLSNNESAGPVVLKAGAKVELKNSGSQFQILFTGVIVDSGSDNNFNSTIIGTFSQS